MHAQISLGTTSDDRFLPDGYVGAFAKMPGLIITEKLDGGNNCIKTPGVFSRSHVGASVHPWDKATRQRWELIKYDLGNLEIFGENMYGLHTIGYKKLESFFYVFAVREGNVWKSWEEVKHIAAKFDFPTVPEIPVNITLKEYYKNKEDNVNLRRVSENKVLDDWLTLNLGMSWEDYAHTSGQLGGYHTKTGKDACEGLVVRNMDEYVRDGGELKVYPNEFNNLFKLVRDGFVEDGDEHWTKHWKPTSLIDYEKYKWYGFEYLSNK